MKTKLKYTLTQIAKTLQKEGFSDATKQYSKETFIGFEVHRLSDIVLPSWLDPKIFVPELVKVDSFTKPHTHWEGVSSFYFLGSGEQYAGGSKKIKESVKLWLGIDTEDKVLMAPYFPNEEKRFFFIPSGVAHSVDSGGEDCIWFLALHTPPIQGKYNISRDIDDVTHPEFEYITLK